MKHVIIELEKDFINETVPEDREFFCNELKSVAESPKFMNCFGFKMTIFISDSKSGSSRAGQSQSINICISGILYNELQSCILCFKDAPYVCKILTKFGNITGILALR